ncbi:GNAT family N-acetyltransferase [Actinocatenispora rupis]|uniref:FMN reductase n=1 Tax=Actinocatenispora rupis TaxID=519421 RepID=A0A8J3J0S5_9ACTN|nr:GNAT family N-acetyltransferase [Actinocatenispora rupis]GID12450.1 FMN reductase [Actinocatenispora rupis]
MSQKTRVLVVVASSRPHRVGPAVADWFVRATRTTAAELGVDVEIADLATIGLPFLDEPDHPSTGRYVHAHSRAWSARVSAADAIVLVTPEYNGGMPATLKNALDYLYDEWAFKPVLFLGYGNTSAGTRGVQMARQVTTALRMIPVGADLFLRIADTVLDGTVPGSPALDDRARDALAELYRIASVVAPLAAAAPVADDPWHGLTLRRATPDDADEILVLQRCCWVDEALANDTLDIAALHEDAGDVRDWLGTWSVWCLRDRARLVGAVRARRSGDTWQIGRLMVAPDQRGRGIGRALLTYAEAQAPAGLTRTASLTTGSASTHNIRLYRSSGYETVATGAGTVDLVKPL